MKRRIKPICALLAASLIWISPSWASARDREGTPIEILKKDKTEIRGELIAVRASALYLRNDSTGLDEFVNFSDIESVRLPKISPSRGAFAGLFRGGLTGTVIGDLSAKRSASSAERRRLAIIGGLIGASLGAYFGAKNGIQTRDLETIQVGGISAEQFRAVLKRLNSEARIRDRELRWPSPQSAPDDSHESLGGVNEAGRTFLSIA